MKTGISRFFTDILEWLDFFGFFKVQIIVIVAVALTEFTNDSSIMIAAILLWFIITCLQIFGKFLKWNWFGLRDKFYPKPPKPALRPLPIKADAHDVLEMFCAMMQRIDQAMLPYCNYKGWGFLKGRVDLDSGTSSVQFTYDKDWYDMVSVFHDLGYLTDNEGKSGWFIGNDISYRGENISGFEDWAGYNSLKQHGFSSSVIRSSWEQAILATIHNSWPNANIEYCHVSVDTPPEKLAYSIEISTFS